MFIEQIPNTMKWTFLFLVVSLLGSTASASAQRITIALDNARMEKVLAAITEQTGLGVAYSDQVVDLDRRVSVHFTDAELRNVLDRIMEGTSLAYEVRNGKIYLFEKRAEGVAAPQQGKKVTGVVVDSKGEPIIGANVVERGTTNGTITDLDGNPLNHAESIEIGRHVWVGKDVKIGKNVRIADNSIVGWGSIVTRRFDEPNVILAGIPAKVVKRGINWDRRSLNKYMLGR